jgi:hypothetical protein
VQDRKSSSHTGSWARAASWARATGKFASAGYESSFVCEGRSRAHTLLPSERFCTSSDGRLHNSGAAVAPAGTSGREAVPSARGNEMWANSVGFLTGGQSTHSEASMEEQKI